MKTPPRHTRWPIILISQRFIVTCLATWVAAGCCAGRRTVAADLRQLEGRWVRVVTDLPASPATDALPAAFDAAVPQWLDFWQQPASKLDGWRITAYVMADRPFFQRRGLIPDALPDFPHGFQQGDKAWVVAQPSDYYTRHLLLHEGVHALAYRLFGGTGPMWFMEGTAELLATHSGEGADVRLPAIPESRDAAPHWGRIKVIDQRRRAGESLSVESVMRYRNMLHRDVEPYAWTWAVALLLQTYPQYRAELVAAAPRGADRSPQFTRTLYQNLLQQWPVLRAQWRVLVDELDYGYDAARNRVDLSHEAAVWNGRPLALEIAADRGWQSAGVRLAAGTEIEITAAGRYTIGTDPKPWICEPQGVTIRYHRGNPLGMLLAAAVPVDPEPAATTAPLPIQPIGRGGRVRVDQESWLLLRVGDDPAELADNSGTVDVLARRIASDDG